MELRDYLDILKRRKNILIAVPAVAALLVVGLIVVKPKQYQATATVAAPALVGGASSNQYSGANGPKSFVANFTAAVTSPPIVDQVSRDTGVPKNRVKSGVSASEIGTSSLMEVTYKTPKRKEAFNVAQAAASDTIVFLFKTQVQLAQQPVLGAKQNLASVEGQIADLGKSSGLVVPDKDYEVRAQAVASLQSAQAQALANGQGSTAARLQTQIDQMKGQLAAMAPQVQQYTALLTQKDAAVTQLNQAQQALQQSQGQLQAADPKQVVSVGKVHAVSVIGDVLQKGAVSVFAGLFLALGIVAGLELLERMREPAAVEVPTEWTKQPASGQEPFPSRV
ncbi:MAG TPA: Wzz/FepE/Etk N-terminal domain-containing protein [Acidimicrobiales bacterium]|nr:Wzz/FepE/Etk N-terminal domain-containing protein [Acidimicrobiales bacterium]